MGAVDLSEVEKTIWMASGWQADQTYVDTVLSTVERYAKNPAEPDRLTTAQPEPVPDPEPEPAAPAMTAVPLSQTPVQAYQDGDGKVWLLLGAAPKPPQSGQKKVCTECGARKSVEKFRVYARDRSMHRPICRECENKRKRERHAEMTKGAVAK